MKCPICGSKLVGKQLCRYCHITDDQIKNASNKLVREYRKTGNTDMIHYTNVIPNDLERWKIIVYTILLGLIGINHYYINRPRRATFSLISTFGSIIIFIIGISWGFSGVVKIIYNILFEVLFYMMAINVILWVSNIISVIFGSFKVPVVLGSKEK